MNKDQLSLFDNPPAWTDHWQDMPEFIQEDQTSLDSVKIHFRNAEDRRAFSKLVEQPISPLTQSIWYPKAEIGRYANKQYITESKILPRYPIYIISKGRWELRHTSKALEAIGIPYNIVIEPQEYDNYAAVIDPDKILTLPFRNLGEGSIPARNWVWEHSIKAGAKRHWILDDNLNGFYRLNRNLKVPVNTGATFRAAEDFTDRYENGCANWTK